MARTHSKINIGFFMMAVVSWRGRGSISLYISPKKAIKSIIL
jgi:hypothetical protein